MNKRNDIVSAISFIAMACVVISHTRCNSRLEECVIPFIGYWSVPWFFCVSGYYFVRSFAKRGIRDVLIQKYKTLMIPYLLWCAFGLCVMLAVEGINNVSCVDGFGFGNSFQPAYNRPLWFVRTLLFYFVFASVGLSIDKLFCKKYRWSKMILPLFLAICMFICSGVCEIYVTSLGPKTNQVFFILGCTVSVLTQNAFRWSAPK